MSIVPVHAGAPGAGAERARIAATPEIISNPLVRGFHDFWAARCCDGRLPAKRDMDPVDMRAFLPHLVLTEVLRDPLDFQYRIIGDAVAARLGNNTGRRVRETALINLTSSAYDNYCAVALSGQPQFLEGRSTTPFTQNRTYLMSRVHCPLASDGARVEHIISCMTFL
jgi:hypothetical protein